MLGAIGKSDVKQISDSQLFDLRHFVAQCSRNIYFTSKEQAISYYLKHKSTWRYSCSNSFDGSWYLDEYTDVNINGKNPLLHFIQYGRKEGRLPLKNRAFPYEKYLWAGLHEIMQPKLKNLVGVSNTNSVEKSYALWALARWSNYCNELAQALTYIELFHANETQYPHHPGPLLLFIDLLTKSTQYQQARDWINKGKTIFLNNSDLLLLEANLVYFANGSSTSSNRLDKINRIYEKFDIDSLAMSTDCNRLNLGGLTSTSNKLEDSTTKVSVVVPVFNGSKFISTALNCLLAQTWNYLEVIIVDDASEDNTCQVISDWIERHHRQFGNKTFQLKNKDKNTGAYSVRNTGIDIASGNYLTIHDADDYSHPQKIAMQVKAIEKTQSKASISYWVRCTYELLFEGWRIEDSLIYRNVSSLMITREVFDDLGYWDQVRFGADTEYYERLISRFGEAAITEVLPHVPLSFGLSDSRSLTQTKASHLVTQFSGLRKDYMSSARLWHTSSTPNLYMPKDAKIRKFPIPVCLLSTGQKNAEITEPRDHLRYSYFWDEKWYILRYKQLQDQSIDPVEHFVTQGLHSDYDPSPKLSISWLKSFYKVEQDIATIKEWHNTLASDEEFFIKGNNACTGPCILMCAHASGKTLFGAELSFLDMVRAASSLGYRICISLPSAENEDYIASLLPDCAGIFIVNDAWWQKGSEVELINVVRFERIIKAEKVRLIHANTLVQNSIYQAALSQNVPIITHVREYLTGDSSLLDVLCSNPYESYNRVYKNSSCLIVNSPQLKKDIVNQLELNDEIAESVHVLPNIFELPEKCTLKILQSDTRLAHSMRFGLVSSNIEKKGVRDAVSLADSLQAEGYSGIEIVLIGPETELITQLMQEKRAGKHQLIRYIGYLERAEEIYEEVDVVLNLSHFAESFGRTVLEGMAFGKPTICYNHGALIDLVEHQKTGLLIPYKDQKALLEAVLNLKDDNNLYEKLSEQAQKSVETNYSMNCYTMLLKQLYKRFL